MAFAVVPGKNFSDVDSTVLDQADEAKECQFFSTENPHPPEEKPGWQHPGSGGA